MEIFDTITIKIVARLILILAVVDGVMNFSRSSSEAFTITEPGEDSSEDAGHRTGRSHNLVENGRFKRSYAYKKLWPNGIVPFYIRNETFNNDERDIITRCMCHIQHLASGTVHFQPLNRYSIITNIDHVVIQRAASPSSCQSAVGRVGGRNPQPLNLGTQCFGASGRYILHEILHTLGAVHEHNRPDRDAYVRVHWQNVQPKFRHNFERRTDFDVWTLDKPYDYRSIMHYRRNELSIALNRPTLSALSANQEQKLSSQSNDLSELDVEKLRAAYGRSKSDRPDTVVIDTSTILRCEKFNDEKFGKNRYGSDLLRIINIDYSSARINVWVNVTACGIILLIIVVLVLMAILMIKRKRRRRTNNNKTNKRYEQHPFLLS